MSYWDDLKALTGIAQQALDETRSRLRAQGLQPDPSIANELARLRTESILNQQQLNQQRAEMAQMEYEQRLRDLLNQQAQRISSNPFTGLGTSVSPQQGSLTLADMQKAYESLMGRNIQPTDPGIPKKKKAPEMLRNVLEEVESEIADESTSQ